MSKWLEVTCTIVKTFAVEINDNEDEGAAYDAVHNNLTGDDNGNLDMTHEHLDTPQKVESSKRFATEVIDL